MAVGRIDMSLDDFCRCTPLEFSAIAEGWNEGEQARQRAAWERARLQCTCMLQPYSKKRLEPQDVLKFEWDNQIADASKKAERLTTKQIRERFENAKREQGLE